MRLRSLGLYLVGLVALSTLAWFGQHRTSHVDPVLASAGPPTIATVPSAPVVPVASPAPAAAAAPAVAAGPRVDAAWVSRTAAASGVPAVALTAYARAVLAAPASCHLGWTTLAGIGWVESQNGTLGGRSLAADGHPSAPILGPALDGSAFAAVPATRTSATYDGDTRWDHALGPLQFLPSTWRTWGRDGDGDGTADPQDLDDAAATAAAYLCGTGYDLTTGSGWSAAVFAYNHSQSYVDSVYLAASTYAARTDRPSR